MFKQTLFCASLVAATTISPANAQQSVTAAAGITQAPQQKMQVPGTNYKFVLGSFALSPGANAPIETLLTALVNWLSDNFDLPATNDLPRVVPMSSEAMTKLYYQPFLKDRHQERSVPENQAQSDQQRRVVSLYGIQKKTIYLLPGWSGRTPAELSMLIHELAHHLQNVSHTEYACPQEREKLAYQAQEKWLSLFGRDLFRDFQIDRFTLLLNTNCGP